MNELDNVSHMPEGVDSGQWDRLVAARRRKWESEMKVRGGEGVCNMKHRAQCKRNFVWLQVKAVALQLADMESFLKRRQVEEERIQTEIQDAFAELNRSAAF